MRIFTLDIETSPMDAWSFRVWQTNILPIHIKHPTRMLTWAGKFKGETKVHYRTFRDKDFLEFLWVLLNDADVVVHFNGDKFDMLHINREFLEAGLAPTRPCPSVDMLKVVKKRFKFPHNSLAYVASVVLGEKKLETGGFELWPAFMEGVEKAQRIMERYNKKDVRLTERLYKKLLPWIPNHPYAGLIPAELGDEDINYTCPACQSKQVSKERPRRTRCFAIRLLRCRKCGSWSDGKRKKL